ncbi:hypothetical protein OU994_30685 [Pseudoduganella sp. SL102]|uniref:hypothetical protein n=1 Tax=Pseudoduganella sp. SL102 TaxID=2995154 RepID=UPI00248AEABD|nr:hypothetical protein [Pseudoduganella sp. SL102]WBS02556.1 hypothetical protein OU994_30685 [Pseudoduganella sp. SL102]
MSSEKEKWQHLISGYPGDFSFRAKLLPIFPLAINEFNKLSSGNWSLEDYEILVEVNEDESYAAISFLPDPEYLIDGVPFEVAHRGIFKNGMGVTYVYCLKDLSLVNITYMR